MGTELYPLRLEPCLSPRVWGGGRLPAMLGRPLPAAGRGAHEEPIGESWMVYQDNLVTNGSYAGLTLGTVAKRRGAALVGDLSAARYGDRVPLLSKLIDAADALSVQVHPDDAYAMEHERESGHLGKSEAWYVLDAAPDAAVLWGFIADETPASIVRAVADGTLETRMNRVPVAPGDVIHNPAGTVHAILGGILLFEIQQSSDLTYRLYDHGRVGADGEPRALHLEQALAVAHLRGGEHARVAPQRLSDGWVRRVLDPHFVLDSCLLGPLGASDAGAGSGSAPADPAAASGEVRSASRRAAERSNHLARVALDQSDAVLGKVRVTTSPESLQLLQATRGAAVLTWRNGEELLDTARALVLPAALGSYTLAAAGAEPVEILRCAVAPPPTGPAVQAV